MGDMNPGMEAGNISNLQSILLRHKLMAMGSLLIGLD